LFDLRYHVVSLAAVFLALVLGVLLGVGISETGRVDDVERESYEARISDLEQRLDAAAEQDVAGERERKAAQAIIKEAYPALMEDRLEGRRVARIYVGSAEGAIESGVERMLTDAGAGASPYLRALKVPIDPDAIERALDGRAELARFQGDGRFDDLGAQLADEILSEGETPLWDALASHLVLNEEGSSRRAADAVVVARTVEPQQKETAALLSGFYRRLANAAVPVVAVEASDTKPSGVPVYKRMRLSTVDSIDTEIGRLAAALVLGGAPEGNYGLKATADRILPPGIEAVQPATTTLC
jgi:Copper transport outer membrane protein, MctB